MTISYNWLSEYLPVSVEPERLNKILTSIGLEVESFEPYESIKGGLKGLVIGEVIECNVHPNADKLKLTKVNIGTSTLQIVCGAPNVAAGQKVIVAQAGTTIFPKAGEPLTMKIAKIRGVESYGMICAGDEIGLNDDHDGIVILSDDLKVGAAVADHFEVYNDWIYEIGLTPNRMDAMSHLGVAKDVCAYLTHHDKKDLKVKSPNTNSFKTENNTQKISVIVENQNACQRYSGVTIANVTVKESPQWLQNKLKAIGQRPINNIVDITNFVLHETGQPLHAFDADKIKGKKIIVKNLPDGTNFITLDEKERKLNKEDLMICNGESEGMCIAGVFGGVHSGIGNNSKNIFLESAWFNPVDIRKTSFRHGLRTDAAIHFEKNIDISNTVNVLKRAAAMIKQIAGGEIASEIVDVYSQPKEKEQVTVKYHYLKKLSGKNYHPDSVKKILQSLGFEIVKDGLDALLVAVPFNKPDIALPADIVEEIMRIDGYDNIEIPAAITITPSIETEGYIHTYKEKAANYLTGLGFNEIFTNSITNAAYFEKDELETTVKLLNNLSVVHNIMRPSMLETGLETVGWNLNRKNNDLKLFEFGKTYTTPAPGNYNEEDHLCVYITGNISPMGWKQKEQKADLFFLKGVIAGLLKLVGFEMENTSILQSKKLSNALQVTVNNELIAELGAVQLHELKRFDIKQPVFFADIHWHVLLKHLAGIQIKFKELPKQLPVQRDLALVVSKNLQYDVIEKSIRKIKLDKLQEIQLFDVFENEKLGVDKKSMAVSLSFLDKEKTLTDTEIDGMMHKLMTTLEKELNAEIRK